MVDCESNHVETVMGPGVKRCPVCKAAIGKKGGNLGIDECRACYVFYRRVHNNGTILKCRTGTDGCKLDRDNVWACKKCRYSHIKEVITEQQCADSLIPRCEFPPACSSYPLDELGPMIVGPILERFRRCYNDYCRQCLIIDFGSLENLPLNDKGFVEDDFLTSNFSLTSIKRQYEEVHNFLVAASDEYAVMRQEHQTRLYTHFYGIWLTLECLYRTVKHYPDNPNRLFATMGCYAEVGRTGDYFNKIPDCINKKDAIRAGEEYSYGNIAVWRPIMDRLQMTDEEFIGMTAFILWNLNSDSIPMELVQIAEKGKKAVLHELHVYYNSKGIKDYSARLGEIFLLIPLMEDMIQSSHELLEVYKLLDVIDDETLHLTKLSLE